MGSCNSFWNFKLYFWCCCLKYCFMFLCGKHNSICVHIYAFFHWRFSANNALCQDMVNLPEGSAPGTLKPLMIKPQACCVPCSTRIGLSSYSLPHRVYHKFSTPVKQTAWRSWARWPIQKSWNIFRKSSTIGLFISFFLFEALYHCIQVRYFNFRVELWWFTEGGQMNKKYQRRLSFRIGEWKRALRPEGSEWREFSLQRDRPGEKHWVRSQNLRFHISVIPY